MDRLSEKTPFTKIRLYVDSAFLQTYRPTSHDLLKKLLLCLMLFLSTCIATYCFWRVNVEFAERRRSLGLAEDASTNDDFQTLRDATIKLIDDIREDVIYLDSLEDGERLERELFLLNRSYRDLVSPAQDEVQRRKTRRARSVESQRAQLRLKKYVVSRQTQFVNCARFKPFYRGGYLVPPSLEVLHACYKRGVTLRELDGGILRRESGDLRYDLQNLYVPCEDVFGDGVHELTDDLKLDYERCKWAGTLDESQQRIIEGRFPERFLVADGPANLVSSTSRAIFHRTTAPPQVVQPLDPQKFVECSHVDTNELFQGAYSTPTYRSLEYCHSHGVTRDELLRGFSENPELKVRRSDVSNLYIPCMYVFDGHLGYLTKRLKEDYRRCKRVSAVTKSVQYSFENRFSEQLNEDEVTTERTSANATEAHYETTPSSTTVANSDSNIDNSDDKSNNNNNNNNNENNRHAFAKCRSFENQQYLVCIQVIQVFNGSN